MPKAVAKDDRPERHPNGTPRTIHHYGDDGAVVYHDEVEPLTQEEHTQLGYAGKPAQRTTEASAAARKPLGTE